MPIHSLLEIDFLNAKRKPASRSGHRKRASARDDPSSLAGSTRSATRELRQLAPEAAPQNRDCSGDPHEKIRCCALDQNQQKKAQMLDSREALEIGQRQRMSLWKACSELMMPSTRTMATSSMDLKRALEQNLDGVWEFDESQSTVRRCLTEADIQHPAENSPARSPDLLQLFNIFYFNAPERPPSKVLVSVTLEGSIHAIRLLVGYDACVQDVIRASLKAYAKEGLLPRKGSCWEQAYGLHYSQFCLESINPAEAINRLGTRKFFLYPTSTSQNLLKSEASQTSKAKPWWHIFSLI